MKPFKTFCVFTLQSLPYVFSLQPSNCALRFHASALGLISYSGFSVVPVVPGFVGFFS